MSLVTELEELRKKKAIFQNELQSLESTEKTLVVKMKVLEEKLTIQMLEQRIQGKRAVVEDLKSKIVELERRLKTPKENSGTSPMQTRPAEVLIKATPAGSQ